MNQQQEAKFQPVDHYDPQHVLKETGPKTVEIAIEILKGMSVDGVVSLLNSLDYKNLFIDEAQQLGQEICSLIDFDKDLRKIREIAGRLEKIHGEMIQRRAS